MSIVISTKKPLNNGACFDSRVNKAVNLEGNGKTD